MALGVQQLRSARWQRYQSRSICCLLCRGRTICCAPKTNGAPAQMALSEPERLGVVVGTLQDRQRPFLRKVYPHLPVAAELLPMAALSPDCADALVFLSLAFCCCACALHVGARGELAALGLSRH